MTETEPELLFFVVVRDALDLGDEDCSIGLPGEIEALLPWIPGPRFETSLSQHTCQVVLSVGVPPGDRAPIWLYTGSASPTVFPAVGLVGLDGREPAAEGDGK